jgi:hypothetical protein
LFQRIIKDELQLLWIPTMHFTPQSQQPPRKPEPKRERAMYTHVAANTQGDERPRLIVLVAMMNQELRSGPASAAAESVAFQNLLA